MKKLVLSSGLIVVAIVLFNVFGEIRDPTQLTSPVLIFKTAYFLDGGTIGVSLRDKKRKIFHFCLEAPALELLETSPSKYGLQPIKGLDRPRIIYVGAEHPSFNGARPLPVGGEEEQVLLRILEDWLSLQEEPPLRAGIPFDHHYEIEKVVEVLKSRNSGL